jgi:hypothetical protein
MTHCLMQNFFLYINTAIINLKKGGVNIKLLTPKQVIFILF